MLMLKNKHVMHGWVMSSMKLQGVPKVRSCNFMHYNFWSKLYFVHEIARCLLLYQVHIFRSSVTGMPPLFLYHKSHSETIAAWSGIHCVESQMILTILSFFITWYAGAFSNANNIFFELSSWKKSIFWAFIQKKIIIQATTKTLFVLLYKFGMS